MMRNTWRLVRACWHSSTLITSQNNNLIRLISPQTQNLYSTSQSRDAVAGEDYFKHLSVALHRKDPVEPPNTKFKNHLQISKSQKDNKQKEKQELETLEDENEFDSLAEKELKSSDVPKIISQSFNLAAFADKSESIQQLVKLGVDISKWDNDKEIADFIVKANFEKDLKEHIKFLHDIGVSAKDLGNVLTKIPVIFQKRIEDLQVRVNYLESKRFSQEAIGRIVTKAPYFLLFSTQMVDKRLGYLQKEYKLTGDEVRSIITRQPKIAIWNFLKLRDKHFALKEEMGFNPEEVKKMLLDKPKLWLLEHRSFVAKFNYFHLEMKIPHELIAEFPSCLTCRRHLVKQRHLFLKALNRAQYDPKKECYVSLKALVSASDSDFCTEVAKTSVAKFNDFLKTL
ncbi:hypothetical protein CHUAL_001061 [Chamberlinius hualienensis]